VATLSCAGVWASVLMADVTGLVALSQDCSAAEMVCMLNELFGRFDQLAAVCIYVARADWQSSISHRAFTELHSHWRILGGGR